MQTIERKWKNKTTVQFKQKLLRNFSEKNFVKKAVFLSGICFVFLMSFFSAFGIIHSSAIQPAVVQIASCQQCSSVTFGSAVTSGNLLVVTSNLVAGTTCAASGLVTDSLGNSFFRFLQVFNPGYSNDAICVWQVTSAFSGADTVTLTGGVNSLAAFELFDFTTNGSQNAQGGSSCTTGCTNSYSYHASTSINAGVLTVELASGVTSTFYTGTLTMTGGFTPIVNGGPASFHPETAISYLFGTGGSSQNFPVTFSGYGTGASQEPISFDVVGVTFVALSPYNPFSTFTSVYSISWTNSTCATGSGSSCTVTTAYTIVSYDSTSTNVTIIQCDHDNGCVTFTQSANKTVTYTASSVILTTSTLTKTVTNTAINAPTGFQLQFWLVPLIFLLGPAFGVMGGYASVVKERGGNPAANTAAMLFMLGLNIGALGGIILKVMPFPVLILTLIPLVLLLYLSR